MEQNRGKIIVYLINLSDNNIFVFHFFSFGNIFLGAHNVRTLPFSVSIRPWIFLLKSCVNKGSLFTQFLSISSTNLWKLEIYFFSNLLKDYSEAFVPWSPSETCRSEAVNLNISIICIIFIIPPIKFLNYLCGKHCFCAWGKEKYVPSNLCWYFPFLWINIIYVEK